MFVFLGKESCNKIVIKSGMTSLWSPNFLRKKENFSEFWPVRFCYNNRMVRFTTTILAHFENRQIKFFCRVLGRSTMSLTRIAKVKLSALHPNYQQYQIFGEDWKSPWTSFSRSNCRNFTHILRCVKFSKFRCLAVATKRLDREATFHGTNITLGKGH